VHNLHEADVVIVGAGYTGLSAALTLARGLSRRRDYALRIALGASRAAIAGEVLAEVAVLTGAGAMVGFALTYALLGAFTRIIPLEFTWTWLEPPVMNARVFLYAGLAVLAAIVVSGAFPAWRASRASPSEPLKDNAGTTTGRARNEFRVLVIGEMAIAMVLLMMASLMSLSARNIMTYDFGFDTQRLLRALVVLRAADRTAAGTGVRAQRNNILALLRSAPGISAAALEDYGGASREQIISDRTATGEPALPRSRYVRGGDGFFGALGVRIIEGRDFNAADERGVGAVILSQRAAKILFPRGGAVGHSITSGSVDKPGPWVPVVGVAADIMPSVVPDPEALDPLVYVAIQDSTRTYWNFLVRTSRRDVTLPLALQRTLRDAVPGRSVVDVSWYTEGMDQQIRINAFFAKLFGSLGFAALLLAATGLFSVLSYVVGRRMREFAVRTALGATPRNVLLVVMKSAFELALGGTAIGALLSFWASAGVSTLLFGIKNTDPVSLVTAELVLLAVAMAAAVVPALRATRADPVEVLRAI